MQDIPLSGPNRQPRSYLCCFSHKILRECQTPQSPPFIVDTHDTLALHIQLWPALIMAIIKLRLYSARKCCFKREKNTLRASQFYSKRRVGTQNRRSQEKYNCTVAEIML